MQELEQNKKTCQNELTIHRNNLSNDLNNKDLKTEREQKTIIILILLLSAKEKERLIKKAKTQRKYRARNLKKEKLRQIQYHRKNKEKRREKCRATSKLYYYKNKEKISAYKRKYSKENRLKLNETKRKRLANDIQARLKSNLRSRIAGIMKGRSKAGSAVKDLGCSPKELITYLESKFLPGMTWENYGLHYGKDENGDTFEVKSWHVDHIIPLDSFDLTKRDEFLISCHYTNLQPLWAKENISKNNKIKN